MASEVEPPFVPAPENIGWLHSAPESLLASRMEYRVRSLAAPATGARRSGRHDILLGIWIHQLGNCDNRLQSERCAVSGPCCCLPLCCPHTDSSPHPRERRLLRAPRSRLPLTKQLPCQLCAPIRRTRSFPSVQRRKSGGARPGNFAKPSSYRNDHGCGRL